MCIILHQYKQEVVIHEITTAVTRAIKQYNKNNIIKTINKNFDKLSSAMADGKSANEKRYREQIQELERKREVLEWVLN